MKIIESFMLKDRAFKVLNIEQYSATNTIDNVGHIELIQPKEEFYILRMLIKRMFNDYQIPNELSWCKSLIEKADAYQKEMGIIQPFVYLTIRKGFVKSTTDDEWHVDGFSKTITHLPEQNYIWTDILPTEYIEKSFIIPKDFNPLKHNIHKYFQKRIDYTDDIKTMGSKVLYGLDPYIIHRRPEINNTIERCFIRLSFTPIEIEDINNTINPLIETYYKRDGIKEMRNQLVDYDLE